MAIQDFLDTSDAPSDKLMKTGVPGSFSAAARYGAFQPRRTIWPVAHGLSFESMPDGVWSSNGSNWYPFGVTPPDTSGAQPTFQTTEVDVYVDETNFYVVCTNYTAGAVTINFLVDLVSRS